MQRLTLLDVFDNPGCPGEYNAIQFGDWSLIRGGQNDPILRVDGDSDCLAFMAPTDCIVNSGCAPEHRRTLRRTHNPCLLFISSTIASARGSIDSVGNPDARS